MSLNGKGINETNELDCLRELVVQGGDDASGGGALTDTQLRASSVAVKQPGAATLTTTQVTAGVVATLVAARSTRRSVLIRNNGTSTDEVSVGEATVTTTHGTRLKAGESCAFTFVGLIQVLAITGTPIVTAADEYD